MFGPEPSSSNFDRIAEADYFPLLEVALDQLRGRRRLSPVVQARLPPGHDCRPPRGVSA
jgi:hypothetical protein